MTEAPTPLHCTDCRQPLTVEEMTAAAYERVHGSTVEPRCDDCYSRWLVEQCGYCEGIARVDCPWHGRGERE